VRECSVPIPDFQTLMLPLLEALSDGQERLIREVAASLADRFKLTEEERQEKLPSGQQTVISNRVAWSKTHLKSAGLIENPTRGRIRLSDLGRSVLAKKPGTVNGRFLRQFQPYLKFIGQIEVEDGPGAAGEQTAVAESRKTPLELLDESHRTLRKATVEELLSRLKTCSPGFFEEVVVKLLRAMGYGGVTGEATVTGKPGDGGIDGVIKEDKLGLDVVCIQAKRWEGSVGRPVIQQFVGSMNYARARKGVILTTSQFTRDATEFVDRIEGMKVVLIDGGRLAELMLDHDVGVTRTKVYELKEVSNDFFDEDEGMG
jgi:restriction system protein